MEVGKVDENRVTILKTAIKQGKAGKETTNLFNALDFETGNPISNNDFSAFNIFKDKKGELSLTNEKLRALKLFDINNDGTFSDNEFNLLKVTHDIGDSSLLLGTNIIDFDKNGKLNKTEINMLSKILKNHSKKQKEHMKNEEKLFDKYGETPLQTFKDNPEKTRKILNEIGDDKELLVKVILTQDNAGNTPLHALNAQAKKEILEKIGYDKELVKELLSIKNKKNNTFFHNIDSQNAKIVLDIIGDDEELLENTLLTKNNKGETSLHTINFKTQKVILDKICNNKNLLKKVLFAKNNTNKTIFHISNTKTKKEILDIIGDDKELFKEIILSQDKYGNTPLHCSNEKSQTLILDKIGDDKELLNKILSSKNKLGNTPLHYKEIQPILDKIGDDEELFIKLLFIKNIFGDIPLQDADDKKIKGILDKLNNFKSKEEAKLLLDKMLNTKDRLGHTVRRSLINSPRYKEIENFYK